MERYAGQRLDRPVTDRIRRSSTGDYENLIEIANYLHPEPFCIKHVPAAAVIESDLGLIFMFAVNGVPSSTPAHIDQYMPGNLAHLIQKIPDEAPERIPLLSAVGMVDPGNPLSCMDIRDLSGSPTCIKGFNYSIPGRATRKTEDFCPNSRAGCTERILIEWARYALALQEATGETTLLIPEMTFSPDSPNPLVRFSRDMSLGNFETAVLTEQRAARANARMRLISQIMPCHTCARAIVDSGVQEVCFREMSKYVTEGNVIIDDQDIWSLQYMLNNGVLVVSNSTNTPVIRN